MRLICNKFLEGSPANFGQEDLCPVHSSKLELLISILSKGRCKATLAEAEESAKWIVGDQASLEREFPG